MFQTTIHENLAYGIVGELAFDGPKRAIPAVLKTTTVANNVMGRAFTVVSGATGSPDTAADPKPLIAQAGGDGVFAGILCNPKTQAAYSSDLAPTSTVANGVAVELLQMGEIIVQANGATNVGDLVYFDPATGVLSFAAASATAPEGLTLVPNAVVSRFDNTAASIAVIKLTQ